jgi:hypothetical protein
MKMNNIRVLGNQIDSPPEKSAKSLLKKAAEQRTTEAFFSVAKNRVKQSVCFCCYNSLSGLRAGCWVTTLAAESP